MLACTYSSTLVSTKFNGQKLITIQGALYGIMVLF